MWVKHAACPLCGLVRKRHSLGVPGSRHRSSDRLVLAEKGWLESMQGERPERLQSWGTETEPRGARRPLQSSPRPQSGWAWPPCTVPTAAEDVTVPGTSSKAGLPSVSPCHIPASGAPRGFEWGGALPPRLWGKPRHGGWGVQMAAAKTLTQNSQEVEAAQGPSPATLLGHEKGPSRRPGCHVDEHGGRRVP